MNNINTLARWSFWIGAVIVVATHIYMIALGLPESQMLAHAIINLVAGVLVIGGWMKR